VLQTPFVTKWYNTRWCWNY